MKYNATNCLMLKIQTLETQNISVGFFKVLEFFQTAYWRISTQLGSFVRRVVAKVTTSV